MVWIILVLSLLLLSTSICNLIAASKIKELCRRLAEKEEVINIMVKRGCKQCS